MRGSADHDGVGRQANFGVADNPSGRNFALNYLSSSQRGLADIFGGKSDLKGTDRFTTASWSSLATGAPTLADAVGVIDCELVETIERYDVVIILGRVVATSSNWLITPGAFSRRLSAVIEAAPFKRGMRRLAAGVSIVTAIEEGAPHGLVATSVSSVPAQPEPSLLVCVNSNSSIHDVIHRKGIFCANVLSAGDIELAQRFSVPELRASRFEHGSWVSLATGAPALSARSRVSIVRLRTLSRFIPTRYLSAWCGTSSYGKAD